MGIRGKSLAIFIIALVAASTVLMIKPSNAQTNDSPSPPQFTIKYVDNSLQVQPITSIDPYTGKTIVHDGYLVVNRTIEFIILNQPPQNYGAYYTVRVKGHFEKDWDRELDVISQSLNILFSSSEEGYYYTWMSRGGQEGFQIPSEGKVDFQMRTVSGHYTQVPDSQPTMPWSTGYLTVFNTTAISGWSDIKTLSLPEGSVSITPFLNSPTPSPSVPEFSWLITLPLFIFILTVAVAVRLRKTHQLIV